MKSQTLYYEKRRALVMAMLMVVSVIAMSTVVAGAAAASASNTDVSPNDNLELSVDGSDSVDSNGSAEFDATLINSGDEETTVEVIFEIEGEEVLEEATVSPDDTESVTFVVEGYAFDEGEYDWAVTAGDEETSGVLTVSDDEASDDEDADDENADDEGTDEEVGDDGDADDEGTDEGVGDEEDADDEGTDEGVGDDEDADDEGTDDEESDEGVGDDETGDDEADEEDSMPGFGVGIALFALLAAVLLTFRRHR
jgi:PGF-CTERM protein